MSVAWVAVGAAALGTVAQSRSASKATKAQSDAANQANATELAMYEQNREDNEPFREFGLWGMGKQRNLLENPNAILDDPTYQFELGEGRKAFEGSAAARGGLFSGAAAKELTRYGQNFARSKFNDTYNRYAGLSGMGQQATGQMNALGQSYADSYGNNLIGGANARGAGYIAQGNALSNGLNQGVSAWRNRDQGGGMGGSYGSNFGMGGANNGLMTPAASSAFNYNQYGQNADGITIDGY